MTKVFVPEREALSLTATQNHQARRAVGRWCFFLCVVLVCGSAYFIAPYLLWNYNITRAEQLMKQGLRWPEPREADSLPEIQNQKAVPAILGHLGTAVRWRPDHPQAHRMAGYVYLAQGDWRKAADALTIAQELMPGNQLVAWEAALPYEQMQRVIETASSENILPDLASVPIDAPDEPINTTFCDEKRPGSCYVGLETFVQSYAQYPDEPELHIDSLFMHPPSAVIINHPIAAEQTGLAFLMGLDPNKRGDHSDGATFQISVVPANGERQRIFEHTLNHNTAVRGWVPGWVDLTPWAGQTIELEFRTTGGPDANTVDDWYMWGDVRLTSHRAAEYATQMPGVHFRLALHQAELDHNDLELRGDAAIAASDPMTARRWYERAWLEQAAQSGPGLLLKNVVLAIQTNNVEAQAMFKKRITLTPVLQPVDVGAAQRIVGDQLRWMVDPANTDVPTGEQIPTILGSDGAAAGLIAWSGRTLALINVQQAGRYNLTVRAQNSEEFSADLAMGIDGHQQHQFITDRTATGSTTSSISVDLAAGIHTIDVWFLNDGLENGVDRNAVVSEISLTEE